MNKKTGISRRRFLEALGAGGLVPLLPAAPLSAAQPELRPLGERLTKPPRPCKDCVVGALPWELTNPARNREIEGYASAPSIGAGERIRFYVNVRTKSRGRPAGYDVEIFRLGWYGGDGGIRVAGPIAQAGIAQPEPARDPNSGLIECRWQPQLELTPAGWSSGMYVARLTEKSKGKQSYIKFVVRDDNRTPSLLFQSSATTDQCYNEWGGKSVYFSATGDNTPAVKVSFNRPYGLTFEGQEETFGLGVGFQWEYPMLRFLEKEGYDVAYTTNIDIHSNPRQLLASKAFLSVGHDEYWTWEMRANVETARDAGVDLAFLGSNTCYWQIRFEPSQYTGKPTDTIVAYRYQAFRDSATDTVFDPYSEDPANKHLTTTLWREPIVNKPESALVGVMYYFNSLDGNVIVESPTHWVFNATGLNKGDVLQGLLGYEVDRVFPDALPAYRQEDGFTVLCRSGPTPVFAGDTGSPYSDMTIYRAPSGAWVFASGTNQWPWGLDNYGVSPSRVDPRAQQMMRNVLKRFIEG